MNKTMFLKALLSLIEAVILIFCILLVDYPLFYWNNFFIFIVAVFSIYTYIIAVNSM